jgi:8-oxo-dGTP pyrophosphatase MutT (NUDIX family)
MEDAADKLSAVERALRAHRPVRVSLEGEPSRAAVAILLDPRPDDLHLLFIHRAEHEKDPWSGHMGFPGGRKDPDDPDVLNTVLREVHEEIGIDLRRQARLIAPIDELQGVARGRHLPLVISPFVFALAERVDPRPNHEVQSVLWVPLGFLAEPNNESIVEYFIEGQPMRLPAFIYQDRTIWGLTFRMIRSFLEILGQEEEARPVAGISAGRR